MFLGPTGRKKRRAGKLLSVKDFDGLLTARKIVGGGERGAEEEEAGKTQLGQLKYRKR